jgi:hypothetical protein
MAYEIEHDLAQNAIQNLGDFSNVTVQERSGSEAPLPGCDAIYLNAGATAPLNVWLDALQLNGRLLFPLTPADGPGGMPGMGDMLLVTRSDTNRFDALFICASMWVPCMGARDEETAQKLSVASSVAISETCGRYGAIQDLMTPVGAQATAGGFLTINAESAKWNQAETTHEDSRLRSSHGDAAANCSDSPYSVHGKRSRNRTSENTDCLAKLS